MKELTEEFITNLNSRLSYIPETGELVYKVSNKRKKAGERVESRDSRGYAIVTIDGSNYFVHRLAFVFMLGVWPVGIVDHKDGNIANNSWVNLRDTTWSVNSRNRKTNKNNTSGHRGVSWSKSDGKWQAHISVNGVLKYLGQFTYKEDAIFARMTAEKKYGYWVDVLIEEPLDTSLKDD